MNQHFNYPKHSLCGSGRWLCGRWSCLSAMLLVLLSLLPPVRAQTITQTRNSSFEYGEPGTPLAGLLIKEIVEPNSPQDCLQTSYEYDTYGNKTKVTTAPCVGASGYTIASATARTATSTFAAQAVSVNGVAYAIPAGMFPTSSTNALGQSENKTYDPRFGGVTSLVGPNGLTTTWAYDSFGRKISEKRADGTSTQWAYKLCADTTAPLPGVAPASCNGLSIAGAVAQWAAVEQSYKVDNTVNGHPKYQYHDTLNRVIRAQTKGFDGNASGVPAVTLYQDTKFNHLGQVVASSNVYDANVGPVWSESVYDQLGRVKSTITPDISGTVKTLIVYEGLSTTVTNGKNQKKTTLKNAQGQVAKVTDDVGNTVVYAYDALGQLTATNAGGSITKMAYNQRGQKILMEDPAMGVWRYAYNAFGELVWQSDSLGQTVTMAYDQLGRMTKRVEPDLTSEWSYDKKFDNTVCAKGIGKLCQARADTGYLRTHTYDAVGRIQSTGTLLGTGAITATLSVSYEANTGRVIKKTWPTGYQANYGYTAMGYLKTVTGGSGGATTLASYEVLNIDAQGRIRSYKYGNNITTVKDYNLPSGKLNSIQATLAGGAANGVMNQAYTYDGLSNLRTRQDWTTNVQELFDYDTLNRLTTYKPIGGALNSGSPNYDVGVMYDPRGNITYKSDVGEYWYDGQRPNRMTNVTLSAPANAIRPLTGTRKLSYAFDDYRAGALIPSNSATPLGNGNLMYTVSQDLVQNRHTVRWEDYTSFNMPSAIKYGSLLGSTNPTATATNSDRTLTFVYGPEHQRIKQKVELAANAPAALQSGAGTTWYLNGEDSQGLSYEKEVKTNGITEHKHYLQAGGITFAMQVVRSGSLAAGNPSVPGSTQTSSLRYFHHDPLGSIAAITEGNADTSMGSVIERLAYDPWGKRRNINGLSDTTDSLVGLTTDRGFTEHEHLDEMGVVHMNGRIYDPLVGRFMSADPFIQAPSMLQSYNRYAYVMNNPLNLTDPSGYWSLRGLFRSVDTFIRNPSTTNAFNAHRNVPGVTALDNFVVRNPWAFQIGRAAAGAWGGPWAAAGATGYYTYLVTGGCESCSVKAFGLSLGTAYAFDAAGTAAQGSEYGVGHYASHAAVGCVSSVAGGGQCGAGALSAVAGLAGTQFGEVIGAGTAGRFATSVVAGGIGSSLAGGSFMDGAQTAAYGYLFNSLAHWQIAERNSAKVLLDNGWKVVEHVALTVTDTGGKSFTVIADSIAMRGDMLLITEVKDGLAAKLSPGQKAMFDVAMKGGNISIVSAQKAGEFGMLAGQSLFSQAGEITKLSIRLEAMTGSRAVGQLARTLGTPAGAAVGVLRVLGSVGFGVATFTSGAQ